MLYFLLSNATLYCFWLFWESFVFFFGQDTPLLIRERCRMEFRNVCLMSWGLLSLNSADIKFRMEWPNPLRMRRRHGRFPFTSGLPRVKGKVIPHESREVHTNSPRHGLAGVVKNKFLPREAKPRVVGICFSPQLLNHKWGIGMKLEWQVGNYSRDFVSSSMDLHSYNGVKISTNKPNDEN